MLVAVAVRRTELVAVCPDVGDVRVTVGGATTVTLDTDALAAGSSSMSE